MIFTKINQKNTSKNLGKSQRYTAFTLAEVLITLGIIGVVAALTIPTLMAKTKKQQTTVALKKFYSTMQQAIKLSEVDNGDCSDWEYDSTASHASRLFFEKYLAKYMNYSKIEDSTSNNNAIVYLNDGMIVTLNSGSCVDFAVDINGEKKPNLYGRDLFVFYYCQNKDTLYMHNNFGTYEEKDSRANILSRCQSSSYYCAALLLLDNWEFKDDYPYKL